MLRRLRPQGHGPRGPEEFQVYLHALGTSSCSYGTENHTWTPRYSTWTWPTPLFPHLPPGPQACPAAPQGIGRPQPADPTAPHAAGSPTPPWPAGAAPSRRPGDSVGLLPQPRAHWVGPFSPQLQQDQYWAYVTSALEDMTPEEFRNFIHAMGPTPQVVTQEAQLLTTRPPKVERPKLTQRHRLQHLPALLSQRLHLQPLGQERDVLQAKIKRRQQERDELREARQLASRAPRWRGRSSPNPTGCSTSPPSPHHGC